MGMRILLLPVLFLAVPAFANETSKRAKCEELLKLTDSSRGMPQMFDQLSVMPGMMPARGASSQGVPSPAEVIRRTGEMMPRMMEKMKPAMVKAYMATYSEKEISAMLRFYKSKAGRAMVDRRPQFTSAHR